jgi:hypothetical protein
MASLTSISPRPATRRNVLRGLLAVAACSALGMAEKPQLSVRFFEEASPHDSDHFSRIIQFHHPPHQGYVTSIPSVHEGQIKAVYPFHADDNTWGCTFFLDHNGQTALDIVSTSRRGSTLVAFVATKGGVHQAAELLIDKRITDGIISIPNGLTEKEIDAITKNWPTLGPNKPKPGKKAPSTPISLNGPFSEPKSPNPEAPSRDQATKFPQ